MKLTPKPLAVAASALLTLSASVSAQNTAHNPGDLVLTFQNPGGATGSTQTVIAVAGIGNGTAATASFRDAADGSFTNLTNVGAALTAAFGANWWEQPTLFMAAFANRGTSDTLTNLLTLDPNRTLYFTRARNSIGIVGEQNSSAVTVGNSSAFTNIAVGMNAPKSNLESISGNNPIATINTTSSSVDDQLPTTAAGVQGLAFGQITGGIQDNFGTGSLGAFGDAGNVELALDLFRMQARNDIAGQYGFGAPVGQSEFLGTITINAAGDVGFTANAAPIPEPSTALMGLFASAVAVSIRRRRAVVVA